MEKGWFSFSEIVGIRIEMYLSQSILRHLAAQAHKDQSKNLAQLTVQE